MSAPKRTTIRALATLMAIGSLGVGFLVSQWIRGNDVPMGAVPQRSSIDGTTSREASPSTREGNGDPGAVSASSDGINAVARTLPLGAADGRRDLVVRVESDAGPVDRPGRVLAVVDSDLFGPATRIGSDFTLEKLPLAAVEISCSEFAGFYDETISVSVEEGPGAQRLTVQLRRVFEVPVRILDPTGAPLHEGLGNGFPGFRRTPLVIATLAAPQHVLDTPPPADGSRYAAGRYRASSIREFDGVLECLAPPPLVASLVVGNTVVASQPVQGSESEVVFMASPSEVESSLAGLFARILDGPSGRPIDGSDFSGWAGFSVVPASQGGIAALLPLDASGVIEIEGLPPGPVILTIEVRGYATLQERVDLRPGSVRDLGPVRLWPSCCVEGTVKDAAGSPVSAKVWIGKARDDDQGMARGLGRASNQSSESPVDGWFAVCSLPRGELFIGVEGDQWAVNPVRVIAQEALVDGVSLVARKGTRVDLKMSEVTDGDVWLLVRDAREAPVWSCSARASAPTFLHLLPGSYMATAGQGPAALWSANFDVGERDMSVEFLPTE